MSGVDEESAAERAGWGVGRAQRWREWAVQALRSMHGIGIENMLTRVSHGASALREALSGPDPQPR